jgi:hypothetical protein
VVLPWWDERDPLTFESFAPLRLGDSVRAFLDREEDASSEAFLLAVTAWLKSVEFTSSRWGLWGMGIH